MGKKSLSDKRFHIPENKIEEIIIIFSFKGCSFNKLNYLWSAF
jgi:hypothetical protein